MGMFWGWFLGEDDEKLKIMIKRREERIFALQLEIEDIKKELQCRENKNKQD